LRRVGFFISQKEQDLMNISIEKQRNFFSVRSLLTVESITAILLTAIPLLLFALFALLIPTVAQSGALGGSLAWAPSLGVSFSWQLDGLALLFALLITGIGALVMLYASGYLAGDPQLGRFYSYLLLFMLAMIGVVLANNLLLLFICWELTSISSYLLIGFKHRYAESRRAALQALLVTGGGGLALLAGILLLGQVGGTLEINELVARRDLIQTDPRFAAIVLLVLLGALTKSAQFPFHFWLPNAMAAPTPVSAYLHSATMVKAGVYLVARLTPLFAGSALWLGVLTTLGAVTMVMGAFIACRQSDLKRILAYTTISALGTLMLLLGVGTPVALKAALLFLLVHALYKGTLFMVAGAVDHETGTRDITQLGGLRRVMPVTATAALLAGLAMSGIPPFAGFVSKELFYETTLYAPTVAWLLTGAAIVTNLLTIVAAGLVVVRPFFGAMPAPLKAHEVDFRLWVGPLLLTGVGLAAGLLIGPLGNWLMGPAVAAVAGAETTVKLSLWHGINPMLLLSILTVALAVGFWFVQAPLLREAGRLDVGRWLGPGRLYDALIDALPRLARWQTRRLQHGYLRGYLFTVIGAMVLLVGVTMVRLLPLTWPATLSTLYWHEAVTALLMLVAAGVAVTTASRMMAIVAVGVVGLGMTLLFALFSAPDLAMTQFAVETLTVLLFVFVIYRLPHFARLSTPLTRLRDGVLALAAGTVMAILVLAAIDVPHSTQVSDYYASQSWLAANGRNVVNVILVDFRALDTLGEIVVLTVAALGVYALVQPLLPTAAGDE
jgi:multicomponent Na+:H+ antiporter subunit A